MNKTNFIRGTESIKYNVLDKTVYSCFYDLVNHRNDFIILIFLNLYTALSNQHNNSKALYIQDKRKQRSKYLK